MIWYRECAEIVERRQQIFSFALVGFSSVLISVLGINPTSAQGTDDLLGAALRLNDAYGLRSYDQCIDNGLGELVCRSDLEALKGRGVAALSRLAEVGTTLHYHNFTEAFTTCFGYDRDFEQLVLCWEEAANELAIAANLSDSEAIDATEHPINVEDLAQHIIDQLACRETPTPLFAFLAMQRLGKISPSERVGFDSISCFRVHGGLEINGLLFTSICGFDESSLSRQLFPEFLWRGPGTSPGQFISLGTDANFANVASWYLQTLGSPNLLSQAVRSENTTFGDRTEVICSNGMRY